jgi:DNA-binding NarL/FixJ family response regulator
MHSYPSEIIIADPHPLFKMAVESCLQRWFPQAHIRSCEKASELLDASLESRPRLVVMELKLADGDAMEVLSQWHPTDETAFVIMSQYKDPKLVRDLCKLGVLAYLHKSSPPDELREAIDHALLGKVFLGKGISLNGYATHEETDKFKDYFHLRYELTPREIEVLAQIKRGLNNREIASELYISEQTVSVHRKNILRKVGVNNTQKLICITFEHEIA